MFDPTIFDNWKVVFEGAMYDLDREGEVEIVSRADLVDLATVSRMFRIGARRPEGIGRAEVRLTAGLVDFAGERYDLRLTDIEPPGIRLEMRLTLPGECIRDITVLHVRLSELWADDAEVSHRVNIAVDPNAPSTSAAASDGSTYEITVLFHDKWNEDRIGELNALQERLLATLDVMEEPASP